MATSLSLSQQLKQQIKLSPAQIQAMRLLELPACELQARINEELQANPALEEGRDTSEEMEFGDLETQDTEYENPLQNEDFNYDDYVQDDDIRENQLYMGNDRPHEDIPFSMGTSFAEYLKSQIYLTKMDKPARHIAKFVVGNIDEDGYLRRTVEELVDDLAFREGLQVADEKMHEIVQQVKQFDPVGVGAYDLQECLLMQLSRKEATESIQLAYKILKDQFEVFSKRNFQKLQQRLMVDEEQLAQAITEITRLNPRPGSAWIGTVVERNQSIVIPDFVVEQEDDDLVITVNHGNIPALHVSAQYKDMMDEYTQPVLQNNAQIREAARFVKTNVENAQYFIDAIRQRNETMMRTIEVLVALQRDFFLQGDSMYLKPLTLKEIADRAGFDISTVSRAFSNKYVQTEFGMFPLKFFFSEGMTNAQGQEVSTREIKQKLREVIEQEDKTNPVTDDQLVEIMHEAGYPIARRTVAKYREQMEIPVARIRRQMIR
jgi:RNA polymerase sigma-54 factor